MQAALTGTPRKNPCCNSARYFLAYAIVMRHIDAMMTADLSCLLQIFRVAALAEERAEGALGSIHGLGLKDVLLMRHIAGADGGRLSRVELAKRLHVSASTITRLAAPLEKIGVIERHVDLRDSRFTYVGLTAAGAELLANAEATLALAAQRLVAQRWSDAERDSLNQLLGRLTAGLPGA
jgi:DNA-binding MarR family transcriptional regulator